MKTNRVVCNLPALVKTKFTRECLSGATGFEGKICSAFKLCAFVPSSIRQNESLAGSLRSFDIFLTIPQHFIQEDSYRGDGLNLYAYCTNNPIMYYDPSGHWGLCPNGKLAPANDDFDRVRNYSDVDLSEIDPKYLADPEYIVEMPFAGKGNKNANSQGQKFYYKE